MFVDENVLRLEVPVENFVLVHVPDPQQDLLHNFLPSLSSTLTSLGSGLLFLLMYLARS